MTGGRDTSRVMRWATALPMLLLAACASSSTGAQVVFDGQSYNLVPGPHASYPSRVMDGRDATWKVVALNGTSWTTLANDADERARPSGGYDVLVMAGGFTDLVGEQDRAREVLADEVAYAEAARARGFDAVVALTIPPSTVIADLGYERERVEHNRLLVESDAFDAVVDIEVDCLDDPRSSCYSDGTHWTGRGARIVAGLLAPVLDDIIP
jgi:hypothetical protein